MRGRVSTVALEHYASFEGYDTPKISGAVYDTHKIGVFPGKKWSGVITLVYDSSYGEYYGNAKTVPRQTEAGWIEYFEDDLYKENYPKYDFTGKKLPDFVNCKWDASDFDNTYQSDGGTPLRNSAPRFLIGDGASPIGPFTLKEALYVYSVVKKVVMSPSFFTSVSGSGGIKSGTLTTGTDTESSSYYLEEDDDSDPYRWFHPRFKRYRESYSAEYGGDYGESLDGGFLLYANMHAHSSYRHASYNGYPMHPQLIIDVDNPEDFYIDGLGFRVWVEANGSATAEKRAEGSGDGYIHGGTATTQSLKRYELLPDLSGRVTVNLDEQTSEMTVKHFLKKLGDSYTSDGFTEKIVSCDCTFKFGNITKTHKYYGEEGGGTWQSTTGENPPAYPSASTSAPLPSLSVSAIEFWPYKNADGEPVYDTTTGAIINPPIP